MRQRITYIGLGSALRIAGLIGLAVWLLPSLLLAGVIVTAVSRVQGLFTRMSSVSVAIPAQQLGPLTLELPPLQLNLIERLGLVPAQQALLGWSGQPLTIAIVLTLGLVLLGALFSSGLVAVAVLVYNFVAPRVGGVEVRLAAR